MSTTPVFVTTHANYDSYKDFWKLVQVSGFETCNQDLVDHNRNCTYIVSPLNGDIEAMLRSKPTERNCKFVLWFLERPGALSRQDFENDIKNKFGANHLDQIWFSDRGMYNLVSTLRGTKFVPMGSDEAIGDPSPAELTYDITHMSYVWGRRSLLNYLPPKIKIGQNCWGEQRHNVLRSSKFMVNIHQDEGQYHEPLRFALCAAYTIPMITEACIDPYPYENGRDCVMVPYSQLENTIKSMLKDDYNQWRSLGLNMWDTATKKFRFRNNVENALV